MQQAQTTTVQGRRPIVPILAVLLSLLLLALPAAAQAQVEDAPPNVSNGIVSPSSLPHTGGTVTISVDAVDDFGITSVYAELRGGDSSPLGVELIPTAGVTYSGSLDIPANFTDSPVSYAVYIQASDAIGATDEQIGEVTVDGQPQFDEAPVVWDPSVEPRELSAAGGAVTIQASAYDLRGITEAYAVIRLPTGDTTAVTLEPISDSRFEGVFTAPANSGTTVVQYPVEIVALDDIGQSATVDAGSISVAARPVLSEGRLKVSPGSRAFGRVRVGGQALRSVVVRHAGPKRTAPIEGVVQISGASFSLPGATTGGISFSLEPGETKVIVVAFRPTGAGHQTGSATIVRSDGGQPGLAVALLGRGA
jgi:hypothetical protein